MKRHKPSEIEKIRLAFEYDVNNSMDVIKEKSYFSESGGYLIFMIGHLNNQDEIKVGKILADNGYMVVLTPEGGFNFRTGRTRKGQFMYADGLIRGYIYEQSTPSPMNKESEGLINSVKNALEHAKQKFAQIAVIYDKVGLFNDESIEKGIDLYKTLNKRKILKIILVGGKGDIKVWKY